VKATPRLLWANIMAEEPSSCSNEFDHQPRTRLIFGNGTLDRLGEMAGELGGRRVLLVTDRGIVKAGHADRAARVLRDAQMSVAVFDAVRENPTTLDVARCVEALTGHDTDLIVGLGGGSAMDTAKGGNFIFTNGGVMRDYWGVGKATKPMLPLIAVPTTAGTGSECQCAALIADEESHQKMACLDPKAAARVAILDPALTVSQPSRVTACTGLDAVTHAVETAVTRRRNAISAMYSREALQRLMPAFPMVLAEPTNLAARGEMLLGAAFAGVAIENSMLGAAHSCGNPLTARFGLTHGHAVGLMLPHLIRFNAASDASARAIYAQLAFATGLATAEHGTDSAVTALVEAIERLLTSGGFPRTLADSGVDRAAIPALATEAARQWTAQFNPCPVTETDFVDLFNRAYEGAA
jgi:alcohol dehydrogenase